MSENNVISMSDRLCGIQNVSPKEHLLKNETTNTYTYQPYNDSAFRLSLILFNVY